MRLIPIPLVEQVLKDTERHWGPFLPLIARRSKESVPALVGRIMRREIRLVLVWNEETNTPMALLGISIHRRGDDLIAEWLWMAGFGRKSWESLLPDLEQLLRQAGCVECRPLCRPGWRKVLERAGYKMTHLQMEKRL